MKRVGIAAIILAAGILASGCGASKQQQSVYYLNFKPEVADVWREMAQKYEEETGVEVKVLTVANGNYEQRLKEEMAKQEAPTLFHINGPIGYNEWKNYCRDLSDTQLYSQLLDQDIAVKSGNGVYGIPYVVEGYGIIYNDAIMQKYFALPSKAVSFSSMEEVDSFQKLEALTEDMTRHKQELGIEGVFASTSFGAGEDWRWQTHLANLPIYYEFSDKNVSDSDTLDFTYSENYKKLFDLYINHSCTPPQELSRKTVRDSMEEFAMEKVAMVQNGNWAWGQIQEVDGYRVLEDNVKFLPVYMGIGDEKKQGLCIGTGNYLSVNSKAPEEEQQAAIAFMEWVYSSDIGKNYVTNQLGFIAPFHTFSDAERPDNPLARGVIEDMEDGSTETVEWIFAAFPSQNFKDSLGSALLNYANGEYTWADVIDLAKSEWAKQKAAKQGTPDKQ